MKRIYAAYFLGVYLFVVAVGLIAHRQQPQVGQINVVAAGCDNAGKTDCTAILNGVIKNASSGVCFYFPRGQYLVSNTIDFSSLPVWSVVGDAMQSGGNSGSTIIGTVAGPLIQANSGGGSCTFSMREMNLVNTSTAPASWAMSVGTNVICGEFDHVAFNGYNGCSLNQPYSVALRSCKFNGRGAASSGIGLLADLSTATGCDSCDFIGWSEGVRASGAGLSIRASRFEVNHIGMNLGMRPDGSNWQLSRSSFSGLSFEANDTHINALNVGGGCEFSGIGARGTIGAPGGLSANGIILQSASATTFNGVQIDGAYSGTAWQVGGTSPMQNVLFNGCRGINSQAPGSTWKVSVPGAKWDACDFRPDNHQNWTVPANATSVTIPLQGPQTTFQGVGQFSAFASPSWATTTWISGKTANSFTVNFGMPNPQPQTMDWEIK